VPASPETARAGVDESRWELARVALPGLDVSRARVEEGDDHLVVVAPGLGVVRISRIQGMASAMRRRCELLTRLGDAGLPFEVPVPLSPVIEIGGNCAVAMSWIPGSAHQEGSGDPAALQSVMVALSEVDAACLADVLEPPHAYAGAGRWGELMLDVVRELPADVQGEARRRIEDALALPSVPPALVHGDLGGPNMRWGRHGQLIGIIDWDWASAWDPAIDAACLSWHGWDCVRAAVDKETCRRARVWYLTFGIEHLVAYQLRGNARSPGITARTAEWIRSTGNRSPAE
jgi:aminoglycoside phosphotransferase (APT) family kinase protein